MNKAPSPPLPTDVSLGALVDAMGVPAMLLAGSQISVANSAMLRLLGLSMQALRSRALANLAAEADVDIIASALDQAITGDGAPPALLARLRSSHGGERHVELTLRRLRPATVPGVLVTCVDLSDIRHVESSLQAMSAMLRQIVDGAPVASFVIDNAHRVTHWNRACEALTGCAAGEMIGRAEAWRAFYPEQRPLLADLIVSGDAGSSLGALYGGAARACSLSEGAYEAEGFFPNFGASGSWLYFTAAPLRDAQGAIVGAIETLQDVSQRKLAEAELVRHRNQLEQLVEARSAELAASARELEAFIDNASIGVIYTSQGKVLRCNRKLVDMFGLEGGTAVGMRTDAFYLSPDDYADIGRIARPLLSQGLPVQHEMWMRHASGRAIWVQMNAYVADHHNTSAGAWWMLQDRTEVQSAQVQLRQRFDELQETNRKLEEAQNQLLQSDKMASIGQLAAGVAHEINNPVGFVSSNLNTLRLYVGDLLTLVDAFAAQADHPDDTQAAAALGDVRAKIELDYLKEDLPELLSESAEGLVRVRKIVQDLKDFSRVDQSEWQEADLNAGLRSTLNVVRHEIKYRAEVVVNLAPLPAVTCLAAQLNQVFLNLIVNASHAIADKGVITLSSGTGGPSDAWVWVQVDDTGCGMSEDVIRRIFEPFYTTKEVGKGTGLGLSLSFSIVQKHGGAIQVRSTPGQGSSFRVWIPAGGPDAIAGTGAVVPSW